MPSPERQRADYERGEIISCPNCAGVVCMGCVLRIYEHDCEEETCPTCMGAGRVRRIVTLEPLLNDGDADA